MTKTKQYFTEKEAIEAVIEELENGFTDCYCDLHNTVFNTAYYIIGTNEATTALEQYNTFEAIQEVIDYETNNFGESHTALNPENIASGLWYIVGENAMENAEFTCILEEAEEDLELPSLWSSAATEKVNSYIATKLRAYADTLPAYEAE